jgi:hypothetical protein
METTKKDNGEQERLFQRLEKQREHIKGIHADITQGIVGCIVSPVSDPYPVPKPSITWSVTKLPFAYAKYAYLQIAALCQSDAKPKSEPETEKE